MQWLIKGKESRDLQQSPRLLACHLDAMSGKDESAIRKCQLISRPGGAHLAAWFSRRKTGLSWLEGTLQ